MLTEVETGLPTTTLAGQPITPKCLMLLSLLIEMVGMLLKKKTSLKNRNSGELPQFDKEYPLKS